MIRNEISGNPQTGNIMPGEAKGLLFKQLDQRNKRIKELPKVMKDKNGNLTVIYSNRVEFYKLHEKQTKSEIDQQDPEVSWEYDEIYGKGWNAFAEIKMAQGSGFKEVHSMRDEE